ncbi:hypothetical protein RJ641_007264 [Dillenia turbinata]|uniref:Uncharacterized protein n=1 Tax=Dillenia turbinata TaxID=194707 RepID=A0AAN8Z7R6_9MAGN
MRLTMPKSAIDHVQEYDTPERLLLNEESAFSKMVQSIGAANAQYLRNLVLGGGENILGRLANSMAEGDGWPLPAGLLLPNLLWLLASLHQILTFKD